MSTINPKEMIEWFRAKAAEFSHIASVLEDTFNSDGQPRVNSSGTSVLSFNVISPETVKAVVAKLGASRYVKVAAILKQMGFQSVNKEEVKRIIEANPNQFEMKGRGWITVRK